MVEHRAFLPPPSIMETFPARNTVDPEVHGPAATITLIASAAISTIFVALRLISRWRMKKIGWDDFWIIFGWIFSTIYFVDITLCIEVWGWKYHVWDLPPHLYKRAAIAEVTGLIFFIVAGSGVRLSLLCFYLHLVRDTGSRTWKYAIWTFMTMTAVLGVVFVIVILCRCMPVYAFWTYPMPHGSTCIQESSATLIAGCLVIIADVCTMILPLPVVLRLNMPLRKRVSVAILLSLGLVTTFASIARTYYLWEALTVSWDVTWMCHPLAITAAIELLVMIVCACLPAIKPLYEVCWDWIEARYAGFKSFRNETDSRSKSALGFEKKLPTTNPEGLSTHIGSTGSDSWTGSAHPLTSCTSVVGKATTIKEDEQPTSMASWLSKRKPTFEESEYDLTSFRGKYGTGKELRRLDSSDGDGITIIRDVQVEFKHL